nr:hypothetical protein [Bradyrhizobium sp. Bra78]
MTVTLCDPARFASDKAHWLNVDAAAAASEVAVAKHSATGRIE